MPELIFQTKLPNSRNQDGILRGLGELWLSSIREALTDPAMLLIASDRGEAFPIIFFDNQNDVLFHHLSRTPFQQSLLVSKLKIHILVLHPIGYHI